MTDIQVQHLLNVLRGIQECLKGIGFVIFLHMIFSGPSTSKITSALEGIANHLYAIKNKP